MASRYAPGNSHLHSRATLYPPPTGSPYSSDGGSGGGGGGGGGGLGGGRGGSPYGDGRSPSPSYRSATPNSRGQYSAATMDELESQNDAQVEGLQAKVRMLKDITEAIGDEVRASNKMIDSLNDSFEITRTRLRGTMGSMLRMARRSGIGWKAWLTFFGAVALVFWWVWL